MISTKVKIFAILLLIAISINPSVSFLFKLPKILDTITEVVGQFGGLKSNKGNGIGKVVSRIGTAALVGLPILELIRTKKRMKGKMLDENKIKNEAFDAQLVRIHNKIRTEAGIKINLKWDEKLEKEATEWANECRKDFKNFGDSRDDTYSQNIYKGDDSEADPQSALELWLNKFEIDENRKCKTGSDCDYILKAANPASKFIGCARSACPNGKDFRSIMVCFYTPA